MGVPSGVRSREMAATAEARETDTGEGTAKRPTCTARTCSSLGCPFECRRARWDMRCGGGCWRRWRRQAWSTGRWPHWWPRDRGSPSSPRRAGSGRTVTTRPTSNRVRSVRKHTVGETTSAAMPSHVGVSTDSLDLQLGHVITRLQQSYPELAEGEIHDIVRAAL